MANAIKPKHLFCTGPRQGLQANPAAAASPPHLPLEFIVKLFFYATPCRRIGIGIDVGALEDDIAASL